MRGAALQAMPLHRAPDDPNSTLAGQYFGISRANSAHPEPPNEGPLCPDFNLRELRGEQAANQDQRLLVRVRHEVYADQFAEREEGLVFAVRHPAAVPFKVARLDSTTGFKVHYRHEFDFSNSFLSATSAAARCRAACRFKSKASTLRESELI
jgi:hypothetical protein